MFKKKNIGILIIFLLSLSIISNVTAVSSDYLTGDEIYMKSNPKVPGPYEFFNTYHNLHHFRDGNELDTDFIATFNLDSLIKFNALEIDYNNITRRYNVKKPFTNRNTPGDNIVIVHDLDGDHRFW